MIGSCRAFLLALAVATAASAQEAPPPPSTPAEATPATPAPSTTPAPAEATPAPAATAPVVGPAARPKNLVTVNVPSNVFGAFSIELGRVLTDHVTLVLEPTYFLIGPQEGFTKGITGPGLVIGTMVHPFGEAPDGLFVMPELYVTHLDVISDTRGPDLGLGAGGVAGYSLRFFDHLMLSLGLGATVNLLGTNMAGDPGFGIMPVLRANVGAAF